MPATAEVFIEQQLIEVYPPPPASYDCPLSALLHGLQVVDSLVWAQLDIPFDVLCNRYAATAQNIGPYGAALFLYLEVQRHIVAHEPGDVDCVVP